MLEQAREETDFVPRIPITFGHVVLSRTIGICCLLIVVYSRPTTTCEQYSPHRVSLGSLRVLMRVENGTQRAKRVINVIGFSQ